MEVAFSAISALHLLLEFSICLPSRSPNVIHLSLYPFLIHTKLFVIIVLWYKGIGTFLSLGTLGMQLGNTGSEENR
ncbi:hypothetical protein B0H67DRAFT_70243 [Lasiosphaeris hirsuta]|uniref:Uncharacterized protein n=1 Tax=Lasiosphaeris hirsuta TaxID=260670 RepID=A0AA40BBV2_9PEZI|nr:hypothetical protein B0H67DRAFT_70243 [Lasiosphaeris hirsuta]